MTGDRLRYPGQMPDDTSELDREEVLVPEGDREYGNDWEAAFAVFRKSDIVRFLKEDDKDSLGILLERLADLIYKIQKFVPYILESIRNFNEGINKEAGPILGLQECLRRLSRLFSRDDEWYESNFLAVFKNAPEAAKHLGVYEKVVDHNFLTGDQWRDLNDNTQFAKSRIIKIEEIKESLAELLRELPLAEEAVVAIAKRAGVEFSQLPQVNINDGPDGVN